MIALALVVAVSRAMRTLNAQPVASLLSKSNRAILPSSAAALVTLHAGAALNVDATTSLFMSKVCGPDIEIPMSCLLGNTDESMKLASDGNTYIRMRGRLPSAPVDMLALLKPEKSCAWALIE